MGLRARVRALEAAIKVPEIQRIEAVDLGPTDILIVHFAGQLTWEEANTANRVFCERFGTNRIIITDGGQVVSTEVLRGLR